MATPLDVINSARTLTDQVGSTQAGTDAELKLWLTEDYPELFRELSRIAPPWFTTTAEVTPSAPGTGTSRFLEVLRVEKKVGTKYYIVPPADPNSSSTPDYLCWRQIGADLQLLPVDQTITDTFLVTFIPDVELPGDTEDFQLPSGLHAILVRKLAARMCERLNLSTSTHDAEVERLMAKARVALTPTQAFPTTISDYDADGVNW